MPDATTQFGADAGGQQRELAATTDPDAAAGEEENMSSSDEGSNHPLPPPWVERVETAAPYAPGESVAAASEEALPPVRRREASVTRPLFDHEQDGEQEFWDTSSFIAMTGRHPVPRPKARTLPPPQRFKPARPWVSYVVLGIVVVGILISLIGVVLVGHYSTDILRPVTTPTVQPTPTVTPIPTATPKPKHK